jgi:predicted RNA binding protein YcfA (HicA-like mRNA interferase family)
MNRRRLLRRLQQGHVQNVDFNDLDNLLRGFGFRLVRITGSHRVYGNDRIHKRLNFQVRNGEAKDYQVRALLVDIERYNLSLEDE